MSDEEDKFSDHRKRYLDDRNGYGFCPRKYVVSGGEENKFGVYERDPNLGYNTLYEPEFDYATASMIVEILNDATALPNNIDDLITWDDLERMLEERGWRGK